MAVADSFIVLFDAVRKRPDAVGHGREGQYFVENGEHALADVSREIGRALVSFRKATTEEVTSFSKVEIDKYYNGVS